ncbi:hypothetical protein CARUB_v10020955mg [Capsella rubella]|uniref:Uncharacterized protein n=1 Tax=Capsella rubella TaxID=81985 RepID=R0GIK3_9BRAS|nr:hypothetical protein CARUB_v10020955mg [Capsella rubella]
MDFMDSETQPPYNLPQLEADHIMLSLLSPECKRFQWKIQIIDNQVIVHFDDDTSQPTGDSGGSLGSWLGQLSTDVRLLPIDYTDWRLVNPVIKEKAWELIQSNFSFDDPMMRKEYVMSALGSRCKDIKLHIWREHKRNDLNEMLQKRPENIPKNQWYHFVHKRFTEKWKKMQERNTKNQRNNTMPHLCGRKSFSSKRNEIVSNFSMI